MLHTPTGGGTTARSPTTGVVLDAGTVFIASTTNIGVAFSSSIRAEGKTAQDARENLAKTILDMLHHGLPPAIVPGPNTKKGMQCQGRGEERLGRVLDSEDDEITEADDEEDSSPLRADSPQKRTPMTDEDEHGKKDMRQPANGHDLDEKPSGTKMKTRSFDSVQKISPEVIHHDAATSSSESDDPAEGPNKSSEDSSDDVELRNLSSPEVNEEARREEGNPTASTGVRALRNGKKLSPNGEERSTDAPRSPRMEQQQQRSSCTETTEMIPTAQQRQHPASRRPSAGSGPESNEHVGTDAKGNDTTEHPEHILPDKVDRAEVSARSSDQRSPARSSPDRSRSRSSPSPRPSDRVSLSEEKDSPTGPCVDAEDDHVHCEDDPVHRADDGTNAANVVVNDETNANVNAPYVSTSSDEDEEVPLYYAEAEDREENTNVTHLHCGGNDHEETSTRRVDQSIHQVGSSSSARDVVNTHNKPHQNSHSSSEEATSSEDENSPDNLRGKRTQYEEPSASPGSRYKATNKASEDHAPDQTTNQDAQTSGSEEGASSENDELLEEMGEAEAFNPDAFVRAKLKADKLRKQREELFNLLERQRGVLAQAKKDYREEAMAQRERIVELMEKKKNVDEKLSRDEIRDLRIEFARRSRELEGGRLVNLDAYLVSKGKHTLSEWAAERAGYDRLELELYKVIAAHPELREKRDPKAPPEERRPMAIPGPWSKGAASSRASCDNSSTRSRQPRQADNAPKQPPSSGPRLFLPLQPASSRVGSLRGMRYQSEANLLRRPATVGGPFAGSGEVSNSSNGSSSNGVQEEEQGSLGRGAPSYTNGAQHYDPFSGTNGAAGSSQANPGTEQQGRFSSYSQDYGPPQSASKGNGKSTASNKGNNCSKTFSTRYDRSTSIGPPAARNTNSSNASDTTSYQHGNNYYGTSGGKSSSTNNYSGGGGYYNSNTSYKSNTHHYSNTNTQGGNSKSSASRGGGKKRYKRNFTASEEKRLLEGATSMKELSEMVKDYAYNDVPEKEKTRIMHKYSEKMKIGRKTITRRRDLSLAPAAFGSFLLRSDE
ncbi:unnamed protein product [Amoebophrya sp. A25]|nr:unnamed protein product [Amoebophrya sp. A25]|eukprot:GSA25T00012689001.1